MAPALSVAPREPHAFDSSEESDKLTPLRRRALASVDNLAIHMEEDDMGLQNQPSLIKDSQEMEQILDDLNSSDLAQADLLSAIKTFESGGDGLSTGDTDAIFPLGAFDLADTADSEGDAAEDKIRLLQARLERRCAFLQRRLRILQARSIGKKISEEAAQTFDKCIKGARKDGGGRPIGLKAFIKRIETTADLQASAASRTVSGPKYYRTNKTRVDPSKSATVGISSGTLTGLEDTAGALKSHLSVVKHELDSDATASSSGAESNDEAVTYNNPHQQQMPIEKRALWSWQKARASIASRWCWLQAQIQELEYKIRQHSELHKQVREAKGPVQFEGEPAAYEGSLPGSDAPPEDDTCARVRPLKRETFKKRKLLQMHNLHLATPKAAKPSDINCSCSYPVESCAVCTGRAEPTEPQPLAAEHRAHRLARAAPAYHTALSAAADIPAPLHVAALAGRAWFRTRGRSRAAHVPRSMSHAATAAHTAHAAHGTHSTHASHTATAPAVITKYKKHPTKLKRGRPPLSRKIKERDRGERDDETSTSNHERGRARSSTETERRQRRVSYDIDNIVIPQSVAASTRPQILTYKEILTPKWRVLEIPEGLLNNSVSKSSARMSMESEDEDMSESAIRARHVRAEHRERGRYARTPRRRPPPPPPPDPSAHNHAGDTYEPDIATAPVPDPAPAHGNHHPPEPDYHETVRPYSPRLFPLPDDTYGDMLADMPDGYLARSPSASPQPLSPQPLSPQPLSTSSPTPLPEDDASSLSPMSVTAFDGDDPDDAEWEPSVEKTERRKSSFR